MSGLSAADRQALVEAIRTGWHDGGMYGRADFDPRWLDGLASVTAADTHAAVEAITTRAVNAALTEAADAIKAVPAMYGSDNYLQALTRAECIVRARVRGESA